MLKKLNIFSQILYIFANLLLILFIPKDKINNFLSIYSIFSILFGILVFILFSKFALKIKFFSKIIFVISCIIIYLNEWSLIIVLYTLLIFLADYGASQTLKNYQNFIFKLLIFLSTIPLVINAISFDQIIYLRLILFLAVISFIFLSSQSVKKLNLNHSYLYVIFSHLFYFSPLFLLTMFYKDLDLKIIFIFTQIMFSIPLKIFDFEIRFKTKLFKNNFVQYIPLILFSFPLFLEFGLIFLAIYTSGLLLIFQTIKLCQIN